MKKIFFGLLLLTPLTIGAELLHVSPLIVFLMAAAAIIPLAKYIGDATEDLALRTSPAIGGLLNATFGNATELIVSLFAIHAGLVEVAKASITGAIIGNLLLVLGTAMFLGGRKRERQHFNATAAKAACSMLILATIALVIPAIFLITSGASYTGDVGLLSIFVSILMIAAYGANLFFTLHTHKHLYAGEEADERSIAPKWSARKSTIILFFATVFVAILSEILVGAIRPVVAQFGWTELFIGVVVVAIVGNVAEHLSAVTAAMKNKMDLSLQIAIGSATQIVMFVAPVLVLVSFFIGTPMNLVFNTFELVAIIFAIFVTNAVVEDGESTWFEGFQLLVAYVIMAVAFFLHP
ncbi:MAG: putative H+/Ca2+ exchanging protein [Parcubacteria group bacterium]|nr:putative H+/Ca2+ exchanging protein [Parcubacteria group bacterium]